MSSLLKRKWKKICKQVTTSVQGSRHKGEVLVVQLGSGFRSVQAPCQSSSMLGWERQKAFLDTITHLKTPGDFQATSQFWFISVFLLDIEIIFSVTYPELEDFPHRFKPSQIHRELVNEWCLIVTCNSILFYPDSFSENNCKIKYILRFLNFSWGCYRHKHIPWYLSASAMLSLCIHGT